MPRKRNTDPGVYQYPTEAGKRWGAVASLGKDPISGKRKQTRKHGFLTKAEALDWKSAQRITKASPIDITSRQPLSAYLDDWIASLVDLAPNTRISYRNNVVPAREQLGHLPIGDITPVIIEQFNMRRAINGSTPAGIYQTHRIFKRAIRRAHVLGLIAANPFDRVKTPKCPDHVPIPWTLDEMRQFLVVNGDDPVWGDLWHVLCETWVRVGEVTDLRWKDIDLKGGSISITHGVARNDDLVLTSGPTKTNSSRRVIHISDELVQRLRLRRLAAIASDNDDIVFPPPRGVGFLHGSAVARALGRSCETAGVPVLTTHDLRHNGGSLAYMDGVDIDVISKRMGHATTAITYAKYIHLNRAHKEAAAQRIGALLRGTSDLNVTPDEMGTEKPA